MIKSVFFYSSLIKYLYHSLVFYEMYYVNCAVEAEGGKCCPGSSMKSKISNDQNWPSNKFQLAVSILIPKLVMVMVFVVCVDDILSEPCNLALVQCYADLYLHSVEPDTVCVAA